MLYVDSRPLTFRTHVVKSFHIDMFSSLCSCDTEHGNSIIPIMTLLEFSMDEDNYKMEILQLALLKAQKR